MNLLSVNMRRGYDLIMSAGSQFDEAATVAPNYPDTTFCVVSMVPSVTATTWLRFSPREYGGSYVTSIIAGYVTENGNFATIGGFPNEPMEHLMDVYETNAIAVAEGRGIEIAKQPVHTQTAGMTWLLASKWQSR